MVSSKTTTKEADMNTLVLSTLVFQALATVVLVVGVAAEAFFPSARTHG
jgi:hypothetical protein